MHVNANHQIPLVHALHQGLEGRVWRQPTHAVQSASSLGISEQGTLQHSIQSVHFNPLHLDNLEFISPNFIPFSVKDWVVWSFCGSLRPQQCEPSGALAVDHHRKEAPGKCSWQWPWWCTVYANQLQPRVSNWMLSQLIDQLLHGFMEVSVPHAMHCREFLSSGPQSSDSASCSERWAPCQARAPQASRNDANAWSGDESFSCKGKWKSGWAQLRSMATNFIACECLMCFSNLMAVKCHKAYWAYCVPLCLRSPRWPPGTKSHPLRSERWPVLPGWLFGLVLVLLCQLCSVQHEPRSRSKPPLPLHELRRMAMSLCLTNSQGTVVLSSTLCPSNPGMSPQLSDLRLPGCRGVSCDSELLGGSWLEEERIINIKYKNKYAF